MVQASGYIYLKVNFNKAFNGDEDDITEYIENNIEEFLEEDIEITDIDITDVEEISKDWATVDEQIDAMREREWERGK